MTGRIFLCDTSGYTKGEPSRCLVIDSLPGCDPRCGEYRTSDGYIAASDWADRMLEHHDQKRCHGCGRMSIWVPHVAADDLGRGCAS